MSEVLRVYQDELVALKNVLANEPNNSVIKEEIAILEDIIVNI